MVSLQERIKHVPLCDTFHVHAGAEAVRLGSVRFQAGCGIAFCFFMS